MAIMCKSAGEIEKMRRSGRIVRQVLDATVAAVKPGITTMDLEAVARRVAEIERVALRPVVLPDVAAGVADLVSGGGEVVGSNVEG